MLADAGNTIQLTNFCSVYHFIMSMFTLVSPEFFKALASCDVWLLYTSFACHTAMGTITGHQLVECCGMTEFDGICNPIGRKHRGGTAGKPFSAKYWKLSELTWQPFANDRFFKTGDAVRVDENGYPARTFGMCKGEIATYKIPSQLSVWNSLATLWGSMDLVYPTKSSWSLSYWLLVTCGPKFYTELYLNFICKTRHIFDFQFSSLDSASTFGAVLDMVTDRVSTACLLVILSQVYRPGLVFLSLLALDISSHWLQMYSTFLVGKTSHKDVKDSSSWLFRLYYGNRMFMGYCCVSCEVLYITLFLLARKETESLIDVLVNTATASWIYLVLLALLLFGWAIKQFVNVIQMKTAADACVLYDINKKQ
ncbi:hypothetical protein H5410_039653 [Solanum commersonii]|uniref:CDP-diacylglycerol--inositol 3-phosphatidyltransferase n=1 Tax=Solanum commersonii TaxID=4109 RepID=A0A9J5XLJ5_SOLCO|nr:hypothetical protein H5410_039653 [Solanum commersonii]